jgi:hypothetical protein
MIQHICTNAVVGDPARVRLFGDTYHTGFNQAEHLLQPLFDLQHIAAGKG